MHTVYNLLLTLLPLLLLPLWLPVVLLVPAWRKGLRSRFGFLTHDQLEAFKALPRPRVWFHAASVGELSVVAPVARLLKDRHPDMAVVISTATLTGLQRARDQFRWAAMVFLAPLDFPGAVRRVMRAIEPNLLAITETELWPNLGREAKRAGSHLVLVNGRMTERSFRRYRRVSGLMRDLMRRFDALAVQSEKDAERYRALGANPQRIKITGSVKFDAPAVPRERLDALRADLRLSPERPVWVAGSTRPGEEEILLDAFARVRERVPDAVLILAPRHLERLKELERMLSARRLSFTRRTQVENELLDFPVILLDTMGELSQVYGLGRAAFVGGSLAPMGGHNPLEPAALGVPVVFGPHMDHFSRTAELLVERGGACRVAGAEDLALAVSRWLRDPEESQRAGELARMTVVAHQGAAAQTVDILQKLMLIKRWGNEVKKWREESLQASAARPARDARADDWPEW